VIVLDASALLELLLNTVIGANDREAYRGPGVGNSRSTSCRCGSRTGAAKVRSEGRPHAGRSGAGSCGPPRAGSTATRTRAVARSRVGTASGRERV
jgi:hypothetical protein